MQCYVLLRSQVASINSRALHTQSFEIDHLLYIGEQGVKSPTEGL
jgi:hypothetical protein